MRYHGKHEVNFNIKLDGTLCGTVLASPEDVKEQLQRIDARIHKAIAKEFSGEEVDYSLDTVVEIDEPRLIAKDVVTAFSASMPSFFAYTDLRLFENIVDSCVDDINQEIIDFGFPDPREAPQSVIIKCTWRAIAMGMWQEL